MRNTTFLSSLIAMVLGIQGCVSKLPRQGFVQSGTYKMNAAMATSGYPRASLIHIPAGYMQDRNYPLLVVLHGAFSKAKEIEEVTGFSDLADREGALVLYPEGIGILGFLQHWNAGHCCGKAEKDGIDDMGFLDAAIDQVKQRFKIDANKIFLVGHSNGAMLVHRYAAERPRQLAGIAVVSGTINSKRDDQPSFPRLPEPRKPLPVCIIHGIEDDSIPYAGGSIPGKHSEREFASVTDAVNHWLGANRCRKEPFRKRIDNGRVTVTDWHECTGGTGVVLYAIEKWGHGWPGPGKMPGTSKDATSIQFNATETIWRFFSDRF